MRTSCERPPLTIARAAPAARAAGSARAGHCAFQFLHDATQDDSDRVIIRVSHHRHSVACPCLARAVPVTAAAATQSVRRRDARCIDHWSHPSEGCDQSDGGMRAFVHVHVHVHTRRSVRARALARARTHLGVMCANTAAALEARIQSTLELPRPPTSRLRSPVAPAACRRWR